MWTQKPAKDQTTDVSVALNAPSQLQWIDTESSFERSEIANTLGGGRTTSQGWEAHTFFNLGPLLSHGVKV